MRVDLRGALHTEARSRRVLLFSGLLSALVVAAAGISGRARFSGARWVPHWRFASRRPTAKGPPRPSSIRLPRITGGHGFRTFPFGMVLVCLLVGAVVVGVACLLWRWWAGRPARAATERHAVLVGATREIAVEPEPEPDTPELLSGIELALQVLGDQREPADAIVRAWLGLEETAQESGIVRRPAETPTEFTSRILRGVFADDASVRTLLRLYLRARFGDHPVTSDDVATVRVVLQGLVSTSCSADSLAVGRAG